MDLLHIVIILIVLSLVWWLFTTYLIPNINEPFRKIIIVIVVVVICLWLLSLVGIGFNTPLWHR